MLSKTELRNWRNLQPPKEANLPVLMFSSDDLLWEVSTQPEDRTWMRIESASGERRPFWVRLQPGAMKFLRVLDPNSFYCALWTDEDIYVVKQIIQAFGLEHWIRKVFSTAGRAKNFHEDFALWEHCRIFFFEGPGDEKRFQARIDEIPDTFHCFGFTHTCDVDFSLWNYLASAVHQQHLWCEQPYISALLQHFQGLRYMCQTRRRICA